MISQSSAPPPPGFPCLAGIGSFADAGSEGLSVEDCVARLKRFHYAWQRVWRTMLARLTAEPMYEVKMGFSHHAHLAAEHIATLRDRVAEMRHPPLGLDAVPDASLAGFFDEILGAPSTLALVSGLYGKALPAMRDAMDRHMKDSNPLVDAPTRRLLRHALLELDDMIAWGAAAMEAMRPPGAAAESREALAELDAWLRELDEWLAAAGGLDGVGRGDADPRPPQPRYSQAPFVHDGSPQRDGRFADPYNMGVHAEEFLHDPAFAERDKVLMMYYRRLREIDVPEMMAALLYEMVQATGDAETGGHPWAFYRDMTRQLWDEARHAMMGEVGFARLGVDWPKYVRVNFTWSKGLNEQLTPQERHAVLWFIEQGQMGRSGKRYEWEVGRESGDRFAELIQDYDWADEVLHARIGRDWYVKDFETVAEAAAYGSCCWDKVVSDWERWKREGLTDHFNWWPSLYAEACRLRKEPPDPDTLAFNKDYSRTRADLHRVSAGSG